MADPLEPDAPPTPLQSVPPRCRCWPNPPCHHHQAGNCGYSQFECQSTKATLPGVVGHGGAPVTVTVSHHPAAQQLQQAMQHGAQQVMGSLSHAGQQMAAAAAATMRGAAAGGMRLHEMEPEFFTR